MHLAHSLAVMRSVDFAAGSVQADSHAEVRHYGITPGNLTKTQF